MIEKIVTESGANYTIDYDKKTWFRLPSERSAEIRSDSGEFLKIDFPVVQGDSRQSIRLFCPPFNPPFYRIILSTEIVSREVLS
jgi:hypothetical protein